MTETQDGLQPAESAGEPANAEASKQEGQACNPCKEEVKRYSFGAQIDRFVQHVESLNVTLAPLRAALRDERVKSGERMEKFLDRHSVEHKVVDGTRMQYSVPAEHFTALMRLTRIYSHSLIAATVVPEIFVVGLVSQFDSLVGRLVRGIYYCRPEMLSASDKAITAAQLMAFASIEEAKEFVIEKEVESVLRQSHAEQFKWLESKLRMPLRKGLDVWPLFVEVTERRNLLVHCDGVVSTQYLNVCRQNKVQLDPSVCVGHKLRVNNEYFSQAFKCVFEIGFKLGHVLWRKVNPDERADADWTLNNECVRLIAAREYDLAVKLLEFATQDLKSHSSAELELALKLNLAQAHKWAARPGECDRILASVDCSALADKFKLAVAVLREAYEDAAVIMRKIGRGQEVSKEDYREWPLFKEFRKLPLFTSTYEEVFGEPALFEQATLEGLDQPAKGSSPSPALTATPGGPETPPQ